jgi:hypothetical protein
LKFKRLEEDPFGDQHWQDPGRKRESEAEDGIFPTKETGEQQSNG